MKSYDAVAFFAIGFSCGLAALSFVVTLLYSPAKDKCEKDLPRTQKCVRIWVPESVKGWKSED